MADIVHVSKKAALLWLREKKCTLCGGGPGPQSQRTDIAKAA